MQETKGTKETKVARETKEITRAENQIFVKNLTGYRRIRQSRSHVQSLRDRLYSWITRRRRRVYCNVKDRLFRFLFENDREALLQLYNALNGTAYTDTSALEVVTIESAVYVVMKNDLAFILAGTLNLYEHQSTYNPNMPVRFLIYLAEEYQKLIGQVEMSLYGSVQIPLPTPQCIVFYNGEKDAPEEQILKLSDAFTNKERQADVELQVRMLNINYGHNEKLMDSCRTLGEYAQFVAVSRQFVSEGMELQEALNASIDYCLEHGILYETLKKHRSEVLGMLLEEFDVDKFVRTIRQEGIQIGLRQGMQQGIQQGTEQGIKQGTERGIDRVNRLTRLLLEQGRIEDLQRSSEDAEYQRTLFHEFDL